MSILGIDLDNLTADANGPQVKRVVNTLEGVPAENLVAEGEAAAAGELQDLLVGFRKRAAREDARFEDTTDSEYWICIAFQTRDQKEEFLQKINCLHLGNKFLDGMLVAGQIGVTLESRIPPMPPQKAGDVRLNGMAMEG